MIMTGDTFVSTLNRITRQKRLRLPALDSQGDVDAVAAWASFLGQCVRAGISVSDPRWQRLTIENERPYTEFVLREEAEGEPDDDFKVGLQLLMGMFGRDSDS